EGLGANWYLDLNLTAEEYRASAKSASHFNVDTAPSTGCSAISETMRERYGRADKRTGPHLTRAKARLSWRTLANGRATQKENGRREIPVDDSR
ncbi:hypothetical protein E4U45_004033, partial [Claviceps purpurea]